MIRNVRSSCQPKYVPRAGDGCVLWYPGQTDPHSATIKDHSGEGNHGTKTGATYVQTDKGLWEWSFDGADDCLNGSSDFIGTTALTIEMWIDPTGWGETNVGRIVDNGKLILFVSATNANLGFTSNAATVAYSANSSISLGTRTHIRVTRTAAGAANFYINDVLSGASDQASGAPVGGASNVIIGNNAAGDRAYNGKIGLISMFNKVRTFSHYRQDRHLFGV